jgi:hypothetical protein
MNKCYLQRWEESERGWGVRPDGASIHIDMNSHKEYVDHVYESRIYKEVPYEYERILGEPIVVYIEDVLFNKLTESKTLRISENELNNLINLDEIIINLSV